MSKELFVMGKTKGVFNDMPYFKLFFSETLDSKRGEGSIPYARNVVGFDGAVRKSYSISCTEEFYNTVEIGEVVEEDSLVFNAKNKLVGCFD